MRRRLWVTVALLLVVGLCLFGINVHLAYTQSSSQNGIGSSRSGGDDSFVPKPLIVYAGDETEELMAGLRATRQPWGWFTGVEAVETLPDQMTGPFLVGQVDDSGSLWTPFYARLHLKLTLYFATNGTVQSPGAALDGSRLGLCAPCRDGRYQGEAAYEWRGLVSLPAYRQQRAALMAEQAVKLVETVKNQQ